MTQSIPLSYLHVWCQKNRLTVSFETVDSDRYQVNAKGVFVQLADGSLSPINPRNVFPSVERYPSLLEQNLTPRATLGGVTYYLGSCDPEIRSAPKPISFKAIHDDVSVYFDRLSHLSPAELYVAVRAYEHGLVSLAHLSRLANSVKDGETVGTNLLRQNLCSWENLLAVCLDVHRSGGKNATLESAMAEFDLCGEILVGLGKITRADLEKALGIKAEGQRPLGEILVEMGVCEAPDVQSCLEAQSQMRDAAPGNVGLLGDLLVENGLVSEHDLHEALRLQKVSRQPLHQILLSMDVCKPAQLNEFARRHPEAVRGQEVNEKVLAEYLLQHHIIEPRELEEAFRVQHRGRQLLGELLVNLQLCNTDDIQRVLSKQSNLRTQTKKEPKKLGELLVSKGVKTQAVEEAARKQEVGRQKLGLTLIGLGACSQQDFSDALKLQFDWRESSKAAEDKLGQELVKNGLLGQKELSSALDLHSRAGKSLGHVLVEHGWCTPEAVIDTLLKRDDRRRRSFFKYVAQHQPARKPKGSGDVVREKPSIVNKISGLFKRQQ